MESKEILYPRVAIARMLSKRLGQIKNRRRPELEEFLSEQRCRSDVGRRVAAFADDGEIEFRPQCREFALHIDYENLDFAE